MQRIFSMKIEKEDDNKMEAKSYWNEIIDKELKEEINTFAVAEIAMKLPLPLAKFHCENNIPVFEIVLDEDGRLCCNCLYFNFFNDIAKANLGVLSQEIVAKIKDSLVNYK